jgi:hypothetical protein
VREQQCADGALTPAAAAARRATATALQEGRRQHRSGKGMRSPQGVRRRGPARRFPTAPIHSISAPRRTRRAAARPATARPARARSTTRSPSARRARAAFPRSPPSSATATGTAAPWARSAARLIPATTRSTAASPAAPPAHIA